MKKSLLILSTLLSLGLVTSCGDGGTNIKREWVEGFDPDLQYKGELDVFMYIYGQNATWTDVGMPGKYDSSDIIDDSQALFFAAAREFKKLYPDIKINVISGDGGETFNQNFNSYINQKGHVPHIMHHIQSTPTLMSNGIVADLSQYKNKFETYNIINPDLMEYFNYGGFQGAVPFGCYPQGIFLNYAALDDVYFTYDDLTENWTVDTLNDIITATPLGESAGIADMNSDWMNFIVPTLYKQYIDNGTMELNTIDVKRFLSMEENWYNYSAFDLDNQVRESLGTYSHWEKAKMFVEGTTRVLLDRSYSMGHYAQLAEQMGNVDDIDFYPWPALNAESESSISLNFGALNAGNMCPLGIENCDENAKLAQEAAAYFCMFMVADTRSIKAASTIEWGITDEKTTRLGAIKGFPVVKKGMKLSFLDNEDEYETQLEYFFDNYSAYENKQGFNMVLDLYENSELYVCSDKVYPFVVPESGAGGTKNILESWSDRYEGDGTIRLGTPGWLGWVESQLSVWTNDINGNSEIAWDYLTERMMSYYTLAEDFDAREKL